MVGNHEKVQRPDQLHRLAGIGNDCLAARHAEAVMHVQSCAYEACIERQFGMEMRIAEEHLIGIGTAGVGRINLFVREVFFGDHDLLRDNGVIAQK